MWWKWNRKLIIAQGDVDGWDGIYILEVMVPIDGVLDIRITPISGSHARAFGMRIPNYNMLPTGNIGLDH